MGEVRTSRAILSLLGILISDQPGSCSFQVECALTTVHRLVVIIFNYAQVSVEATKEIFVQAADLVVQVGLLGGKRSIPGMCKIQPELKAENVLFMQGIDMAMENWGELGGRGGRLRR
jgi:hypothetical protein